MRPEDITERGQGVEPARPRRRGLRDRREVGLRPQGRQGRSTSSCNADESEPGTCKDRELIYWDPHLLIEGMIISAHALKAVHNYIYIRGEMMREYVVLQKAVDEAYARGYLGKNILGTGIECHITVHRGAGAYICGEETALLNSLEGLRGQPRLKPPFPAVKGLFGNPTIVNNVETLMNVPFIIDKGGAVVQRARHGPLGRHAHRVRVGPRQQARRVRAADGHHVQPDHQRRLRRRVEGPQGQGGDPGRRVDAAARRRASSTCRASSTRCRPTSGSSP